MEFSPSQSEAITHVDGPMMVIAGPGSGKTTVICRRIKYLIESAGVSPADILVVTFTKAAAEEMKTRFLELLGKRDSDVRFGTFHSIFFWIIKTAYHLPNDCVMTEAQQRAVLEQLMRSMRLSYDNKKDVIKSVLTQISLVKCDMLDIDSYYSADMPAQAFRKLYLGLDSYMKREGKIDYDDMMVMCYELLRDRPDILEKCQELFPYIMVDEFQDSNRLQYEIFKMLARPRNNAFIVGDDDQSIYGFRGARPEIMRQFQRDFPDTKQVHLDENYRCGVGIVQSSARLIGQNKRRYKKALTAARTAEGQVAFFRPPDVRKQNQLLLEHIKAAARQGTPYEEQAVLYRTNAQPTGLAVLLSSQGIPYTLRDELPNFFEHFAVRNILSYLRLAEGDFSRKNVLNIINKPNRYIRHSVFLEDPVDFNLLCFRLRAKAYAVENLYKLAGHIKKLRSLPLPDAIFYIRKKIGYDKYLEVYASERNLDVSEFFGRLDELADICEDMETVQELLDYMETYREFLTEEKKKSKTRKTGVQIMTMHSAKGLEFERVYIPDAVEKMTPHRQAKTAEEMEEERRLFYVAMTRAKNALSIYAPQMQWGKAAQPSRFYREAGGRV